MSALELHAESEALDASLPSGWGGRAVEAVLVFGLGVLWMSFFYSGRDVPIADIGVPGNDSGYHVKMAAMLPEWGFVREFPWIRFAYFRTAGSEFVSHHVGFHVLLMPFVQLSHWITGDYMAGGRWAICTFFGLLLVVYNALLAAGNVRWRWFWLALLLLLPNHFFMRHANVRAITPALLLMLMVVLAMFRERWILAGLAVMAFNLLYLGAVMFSPILVMAYAAASTFGPRGDRRFPWKIAVGTLAGWLLGVAFYPYLGGMWEFLRLQVFGSGLSPDIRVGTEWYPYDNVWNFIKDQAGPTLLIWIIALLVRLRSGPPLDARALTLCILTVVFLALTLKAQRFIEYWPLLSVLSSAYLLAPPLSRLAAWIDRTIAAPEGRDSRSRLGLLLLVTGCVGGLAILIALWRTGQFARLVSAWQIPVMATLVVLIAAVGAGQSLRLRRGRAAAAVAAAIAVSGSAWAGATWLASSNLTRIQSASKCSYDLNAIRPMMRFIQEHSQPGDVIFTDDWDTFPIFFYHNSFNHYIVGLDPKFTHERRPDIWERYVRITQARNVPGDATVRMPAAGGDRVDERIRVKLEDIREVFGARWVICDQDHRSLAALLRQSPQLAELVYPSASYAKAASAPYIVFRIRTRDEAAALGGVPDSQAAPEADANGILFLGLLEPLSIEQGWGEFCVDASVGGGPIMLAGTRYLNGLGTHAPSRIEYAVPPGFENFESTAGVNSSQSPDGSVVLRVELDGVEVYRSGRLTSSSKPAQIRVPLAAAKRLVLIAEPTDDGTRCDHVDWAGARFVKPIGE